MTLEELLDHAAGFAQKVFNQSGELHPMWIAEDGNDQRFAIATPFTDGDSKSAIAQAMRQMFKLKGVVRYAFMAEAWMIDHTGADAKTLENVVQGNVAVSELPNRIECIQIVAEDRERGVLGSFVISRDLEGKPTLSEFKRFPEYEGSKGLGWIA